MARPALRVLVVDDDSDIRETVALVLERRAATVVAVPDAYQGLALLRAEPFDVAIVDVLLPGASGIELIERAGSLDTDVPIVVLTGLVRHELVDKATAAGALVVHKPFSAEELLDAVDQAVQANDDGPIKSTKLSQ